MMTSLDIPTMPEPPEATLLAAEPTFVPDEALARWMRHVFVEDGGVLLNVDHKHLQQATLGVLWASEMRTKKGRVTLGTAELGRPSGSDAWKKGRAEQQIRGWFGGVPDFIITLYAPWFEQAGAVARCAVIEHELYHCAQATDAFGAPAFYKSTGQPKWTVAPHDVEEFIGVVRRYGAWSDNLKALVATAQRGPTLRQAEIQGVCGTCGTTYS
ncbi:MAG: hypothetical protein GVY18_04525 [Bacteroidetes bacterium]|jgi:hypothetical protein|nr:hypothetical protein [Bacteroidota bacterium]